MKRCAATGCAVLLPVGWLVCTYHERMVPPDLMRAIKSAPAGSPDYHAAVDAVVRSVTT